MNISECDLGKTTVKFLGQSLMVKVHIRTDSEKVEGESSKEIQS